MEKYIFVIFKILQRTKNFEFQKGQSYSAFIKKLSNLHFGVRLKNFWENKIVHSSK